MAAPAVVAVPVAQQAAKAAEGATQALVKVATTPIYSRRTSRETKNRYDEPVTVESEVNITPAGILAGAGAAFLLGLGLAPQRGADGKNHMTVVARPRSLLPLAGQSGGSGEASTPPADSGVPFPALLRKLFYGPGG